MRSSLCGTLTFTGLSFAANRALEWLAAGLVATRSFLGHLHRLPIAIAQPTTASSYDELDTPPQFVIERLIRQPERSPRAPAKREHKQFEEFITFFRRETFSSIGKLNRQLPSHPRGSRGAACYSFKLLAPNSVPGELLAGRFEELVSPRGTKCTAEYRPRYSYLAYIPVV